MIIISVTDLQRKKQREMESLSDNSVQLCGVSLSEVHRRCESAQARLMELCNEVRKQDERITGLETDRDQLLSAKKQLTSYSDISRSVLLIH